MLWFIRDPLLKQQQAYCSKVAYWRTVDELGTFVSKQLSPSITKKCKSICKSYDRLLCVIAQLFKPLGICHKRCIPIMGCDVLPGHMTHENNLFVTSCKPCNAAFLTNFVYFCFFGPNNRLLSLGRTASCRGSPSSTMSPWSAMTTRLSRLTR